MKIISQINSNLCSTKRFKSQNLLKWRVLNITSTSYLIPRQRQISKTKWLPLYTLQKQHQQNRLCVNLSTLSLIFIMLFSYTNYSTYKIIYLSISLSLYLSIYLSIYPSIYLSFYPYIYIYINLLVNAIVRPRQPCSGDSQCQDRIGLISSGSQNNIKNNKQKKTNHNNLVYLRSSSY